VSPSRSEVSMMTIVVAVLAFLSFVTWLGLRHVERTRTPAASNEDVEGVKDVEPQQWPALARRDIIRAETIEEAASKLRNGEDVTKVERWLMMVLQ